jgi:hypothetical protein
MPDDKSTLSPAEQEQNTDGTILLLLTLKDAQRPWSVEEVIRELGSRNNAIDAIARLHGVGLIHRTSDDFVWASRAAIRADEIAI